MRHLIFAGAYALRSYRSEGPKGASTNRGDLDVAYDYVGEHGTVLVDD